MRPSTSMNEKCAPKEVALKSFFLGPQAENAEWLQELFQNIFVRWAEWRRSLFPADGKAISHEDQNLDEFQERQKQFETCALDLMKQFEAEVPKFSPRYVGHMFSEVSLPALVGHIITLLHNPNNISGESSRVGTRLEDEAINALRSMVRYPTDFPIGHFTSGGTIANFEALFRAQARTSLWMASSALLKKHKQETDFNWFASAHQGWASFDESIKHLKQANTPESSLTQWTWGIQNPIQLSKLFSEIANGREFLGPIILVPENKHYSWQKACRMFGMGMESLWLVRLNSEGRLCVQHLKELLSKAHTELRPISMVVSVAGATELGSIDPIDEVQSVLDSYAQSSGHHIWHHVDAAFGGFFCSLLNTSNSTELSDQSIKNLESMNRATSITLDPHKLGYVPYSSGAILIREPRDYYFRAFESAPYIHFDQMTDRGPFTVEGSRSAAGAVATWLTEKTIGFQENGYSRILGRTLRIAQKLREALNNNNLPIRLAPGQDTNVVCFSIISHKKPLSECNKLSLRFFETLSPSKNSDFIVSKTVLNNSAHQEIFQAWTQTFGCPVDVDEIVLIRMTIMNPFFDSVEMRVDFQKEFINNLQNWLKMNNT